MSLVQSRKLSDPMPGSFEGLLFIVNIDEPDDETGWADKIEIYDDPNAAVPLVPGSLKV